MDIAVLIFLMVVAFFLLTIVIGSFFTVQQQSRAIIERFGKFIRTANPGLNFKIPYIERVVERVSLRVQQLMVEVETKTLDNVFVKLFVAVQYRVVEGSEADSYYKLQDHVEQIKSYVLDVVRAKVPKMNLDEVFERKDDVGAAVKSELDVSMKIYGFEIPNALVTDVNPADNVKAAMNEIQTQQRLQVAAAAKGEANKILVGKTPRPRRNPNTFRAKASPSSAAPSSTACANPSPPSPTRSAASTSMRFSTSCC
jgi:regulator of protease activity HflC (stomatin/prohibitin superfamily)